MRKNSVSNSINNTRNWEKDLYKFENFLKSININKYENLRKIKTVEQDLPQELIPLEIYYEYYWNTTNFKDYDEIFRIYWEKKLSYICDFTKKYFYGCSLQFVEEGFRARLYRTWMSILTQFHFQYLWNSIFEEKLLSSPKWDILGIDALVTLKNIKIAIQIKKISYRREASERKFTRRQKKIASILVEVPYLVINEDEMKDKIQSSSVLAKNKQKYIEYLQLFNNYFNKLDNGFVIFQKKYLELVRKKLDEKLENFNNQQTEKELIIPYNEILYVE